MTLIYHIYQFEFICEIMHHLRLHNCLHLTLITLSLGFIPCFRKYLNPGKCMGNIIYHPMSSPYICCKKFPTGGYSFKVCTIIIYTMLYIYVFTYIYVFRYI